MWLLQNVSLFLQFFWHAGDPSASQLDFQISEHPLIAHLQYGVAAWGCVWVVASSERACPFTQGRRSLSLLTASDGELWCLSHFGTTLADERGSVGRKIWSLLWRGTITLNTRDSQEGDTRRVCCNTLTVPASLNDLNSDSLQTLVNATVAS